MWTIYCAAILGAIIGIILMVRENGYDDGFFLIGILPGGFIGCFLGFFIACFLPCTYITTTWDVKLESLQDNSFVNGSFFLGCGQINGTMRYVFYKESADSTYQMGQLNYDDCKIKYTNGLPKLVVTDIREDKSKTINKWAIDVANESTQSYVFEVPRGTIKNNFQLDAQ